MKVLLLHATAGHGHKKTAEVIAKTFRQRGLRGDQVPVVDALSFTPLFFRQGYPAFYQFAVEKMPSLWGAFYEVLDREAIYRFIRPLRLLWNRFVASSLLRMLDHESPDVVIVTHFLSAQLVAWARRKQRFGGKLITVVTDFLPHSFWINEGTDFYWVMGEDGESALAKRGVPKEKILAGGLPVDYAFKPAGRKQEVLEKWGFETKRLTLLLTSGSFGMGPQEAILNALEPFSAQVQCFVVCGNNRSLEVSLKQKRFGFPVQVFAFINFMPDLMEASDLVIAKTGGATTTEALTKGVPMVALAPIPGQETRNAEVLKRNNAAFFVEQPAQIRVIVKAVLDQPGLLEAKCREVHKLAKPNAADDLASFVLQSLPSDK